MTYFEPGNYFPAYPGVSLPFVTIQLHIWVKDHCIQQADQEQKIWSSIRFSSFAHENFILEKKAGTANMPREC